MAKKKPVKKSRKPIRSKRFPVKTIQFTCGDCDKLMVRWNNPYEPKKEHFYVKCPECGMHIRVYEHTYHCIDVNGRCYLETRWNKDIEWKKDFLEKEKNYYENQKRQREQMDELQRQFDAEMTPEKVEKIKKQIDEKENES
ncbi:MAG: hypothetical protein ACFFG0_22585 [Candidatus Thorarchaeota archaeon]